MNRPQRKRKEKLFIWTCRIATWAAVAVLFVLLFHVMREGIEWLDFQFLDSFPSRNLNGQDSNLPCGAVSG